MFYNILFPLHYYVSFFNLFGYVTFRTGGAIMTSLILSLIHISEPTRPY